MTDINEMKEWIQKRIDYWEDFCEENHKKTPTTKRCDRDFEEGMEKGILEGLYQVMEFIDGQRR